MPLSAVDAFRKWWAETKPVWDAEDKARHRKWWGESLAVVEANAKAYANRLAFEARERQRLARRT